MPQPARPVSLRRLLAAGTLASLALTLIGNAVGLGAACPAIYPPSTSCGTDSRGVWAVIGVSVVLASLLVVVMGEVRGRRARSPRSGSQHAAIRTGAALLAASAILFPLAIAYSGSFVIDERGMLLAFASFVACIVLAVVVARESRSETGSTRVGSSPSRQPPG